jgi:hypothetical protein
MKRTRVPLAVLALWLAGSASGGEEATPPRIGLRLETNPREATWSVRWQDTPSRAKEMSLEATKRDGSSRKPFRGVVGRAGREWR